MGNRLLLREPWTFTLSNGSLNNYLYCGIMAWVPELVHRVRPSAQTRGVAQGRGGEGVMTSCFVLPKPSLLNRRHVLFYFVLRVFLSFSGVKGQVGGGGRGGEANDVLVSGFLVHRFLFRASSS